jgi:hypothetical protein
MGMYTDWFLAEESEAEALAAAEVPWDEWPSLSIKSILDTELMLLWGVLRGDPSRMDHISEPLPLSSDPEDPSEWSESGVSVGRVAPDFIAALAALEKPDIDRVASQWQRREGLGEWPLAELAGVLREFVEFARRAVREGKSVLSLFVW